METIHLSHYERIKEARAKLRTADPAEVAATFNYFSKHKDECCQLMLHWMMFWGDCVSEYQRIVCKRQLDLEKEEGLRPTAAESKARAQCVEARLELADANYVKQYYTKTLNRLENQQRDN